MIDVDALHGPHAVLEQSIPVNADRSHKGSPTADCRRCWESLPNPGTRAFPVRTYSIEATGGHRRERLPAALLLSSLGLLPGLRPRHKSTAVHARLDALVAEPGRAGELLVKAWETTRNVAPAAEVYSVRTTHRGVGRIQWFGAAFTSKYLHFAQGSTAELCLLIP